MSAATLISIEGNVARGSDGGAYALPDLFAVTASPYPAGWLLRQPAAAFWAPTGDAPVQFIPLGSPMVQLIAYAETQRQRLSAMAESEARRRKQQEEAEARYKELKQKGGDRRRVAELPVGAVLERKMARGGGKPAWVKCRVVSIDARWIVVETLDPPASRRRFSFEGVSAPESLRLPFAAEKGTALVANVFADWLHENGFADASDALRLAFPLIDATPDVERLQKHVSS